MEVLIAAASALISALVGACGGVAAIVKVSNHLDRRFDDTDDNIRDLTHRYDVQRAKDIARIEMLEYQLGQTVELVNHKANRLENGLFQVSEYLKKNHDYSPRYTFPWREMVVSKPILIFHTELENDGSAYGRLELWETGNHPDLQCLGRYIALSGLPGYQSWNDQDSKGRGPIPRSDKAGIGCYQVGTSAHWVPASQQPGIAGNFYDIFPQYVDNGRGLFGIHFDANVQGTMGCIGIKNSEAWNDFEQQMLAISKTGRTQVPLIIGYS